MLLGNQGIGDVELGSFSIPVTTPVTSIYETPSPAVIALLGNSLTSSGCPKYPRAIGGINFYRPGQVTAWYAHVS